MGKRDDDRSPMALAMEWSTRITTISLEMLIPAAIGYMLDQKWGTHGLCLVVGAILGFCVSLYNLVRLAHSPTEDRRQSDNRGDRQKHNPTDEAGREKSRDK